MISKEELPAWQWNDYGAMNAELRTEISAAKNTDTSSAPENKITKSFGSDVISQSMPDYITTLFRDEFGELATDNIQFYIEAARHGIAFFLASLFKTIRRKDLRVGGLLLERKTAVLSEKFVITVKQWEEGKKYIEELFEDIESKLYDFFSACVEANLQGIKMFELNYAYENGKYTIEEFRPLDNSLYIYDSDLREYSLLDTSRVNVFDVRAKAVQRIYTKVSDLPKQDIHPMKLLQVHGIDGDDENAIMNGIIEALAYAYFHKNYNWKDMQIYIERFASPLIDISYDSVNENVKKDAIKIAKHAKAHGYVIRPKDALAFAYIESQNKAGTVEVFMKPIQYTDTEMSIRVKGQADTTDKLGKNGSKKALDVKKEIADYIKISDLKVISAAFNAVIRRLIDLKFPNPPEYPQAKFVSLAAIEDQEADSRILKNISDSGFEAEPDEVAARFNYQTLVKKTASANNGAPANASKIKIDNIDLAISRIKGGN